MSREDIPQIYLISPAEFDPEAFGPILAELLDTTELACVRLAMSGDDPDRIGRAADTLREICHARDVAIVIARHRMLAERHGLDGVHLEDAAASVRAARKALGPDAIIGAYCGTTRHDGLNAGEAGADYVSFGPVGQTALGDGARAEADLFEWWSQMIEIPVVAEGALDEDTVRKLAPHTDFFGIGPEIWRTDDPATALKTLVAAMRGA